MAKTSPLPRRIIEAVCFDGILGPVSSHELLAMDENQWGILRDRLTDGHHGKADGLVARCIKCSGEVFISTRAINQIRLPFFAHYRGGDPACPWYSGRTLHPDQARAFQYQGHQTSTAHQMLCDTIDKLVRLDSRYIRSAVEEYLPPTENSFGRYPDVYVELRGLPPFAIEIQLSNTFQTEVSARCMHYERERIALLWVLYGIDPQNGDLLQSFRDVIRRHRGNAFVLDHEAVRASHRENTLILKCYLKNEGESYDTPILVRIDQLKFQDRGLPYFKDRIIAPLRAEIDARRKTWFRALRPFPDAWHWIGLKSPEIDKALAELKNVLPDLRCDEYGNRYKIIRLIAVVFSVLRNANGNERNYATEHPNIRAMLNTLLNAGSGVQRYALLIEKLITDSSQCNLMTGTIGIHIGRAKRAAADSLCRDGDPEWELMAHLVPEIFDPLVRETMEYLDALPGWAHNA